MVQPHKLLVVDDEPSILVAIRKVFRGTTTEVLCALNAGDARETFEATRPDVAIVDVHLPDESGLSLFKHFKKLDPRIPVILITGHATNETVIDAIRQGAFDYLFKPLDSVEIQVLVRRALHVSRSQRQQVALKDEEVQSNDVCQLIGKSEAMRKVYKSIGRVSNSDTTVLIAGESGVGKGLIARALYQHSDRSGQVFRAINCAAIPDSLLESEIFGHEKGAFTGADNQHIGKFEQCNGGTLFLDEVGDMSLATQAKLLRIIEDKQFERVGGSTSVETDVRLIAATNRNLKEMMEQGSFREDLFFRLTVYVIRIPPLRDRPEDLPELVDYYLARLSDELGKAIYQASPEAMQKLFEYTWPGNVRELQSILRQWMLASTGTQLVVDEIPPLGSYSINPVEDDSSLFRPDAFHRFVHDRLKSGSKSLYAEYIALAENELFEAVLKYTSGNLSQAALMLGINRRTLRTKIESLGLRPKQNAN